MSFAELDGGRIHYRFDGAPDAPVVVLSHSVGTDLSMWQRQVDALSLRFRVLRYDSRGHGGSLVTAGPYSIELLARDALQLLDRLAISRVHFCGLSLGGMVGMWLAAHEPARVGKLVLANTAAHLPPPEAWDARIKSVREGGMAAIADVVLGRWFTSAFRESSPLDVQAARRTLLTTSPEGYIACCAAIRDMDQRATLKSIWSDTLVIAGQRDPATPPETCRMVADAIRGARCIEFTASHLSNIEAGEAFSAAVLDFLLS